MIPTLLLQDADLLVRQFRNFGKPGPGGLSLEQRRAWAAEMVEVMERLIEAVGPAARDQAGKSSVDIVVEWNRQMAAGERIATVKLTAESAAYLARMREEAKTPPPENKKAPRP